MIGLSDWDIKSLDYGSLGRPDVLVVGYWAGRCEP